MLTGHPDVDFNILYHLPDEQLEHVCQTDRYAHSLCNDYLWFLKSRQLYPTISELKLPWQTLYYKLKYQQWTDIIV